VRSRRSRPLASSLVALALPCPPAPAADFARHRPVHATSVAGSRSPTYGSAACSPPRSGGDRPVAREERPVQAVTPIFSAPFVLRVRRQLITAWRVVCGPFSACCAALRPRAPRVRARVGRLLRDNPRPSGREDTRHGPPARGAPAWAHGRRRVSRKTEGRGPSASRQTFRHGRTGLLAEAVARAYGSIFVMPGGARGAPCARERKKSRLFGRK
jgi:hypothetical protein